MHRHPLDPSITSTVCWYRQAPATAAEITSLRRALAGWLARIGVDDRCRQDVVAAVYEALAKVVEHAYPGRDAGVHGGVVEVDATFVAHEQDLEITVADHGRWRAGMRASHTGSRGRGLELIAALTTHTRVSTAGTGTTVTMSWQADLPV
ncbi:ATP-binding protein [Rhodococcus electrodiphilus]|uniref:ATP-binding protein n=1 Tax=Rhodococcus TaxID=1827 RepID=UPI000C7BCFC4|nr:MULTISPECIES: ATP-binding protein [Rhodococcus]AUM19343.1 ATP-binding protein [Rhodococcus ruber]MDO2380734.1 ATP-binding protein [Rhodococcus ruber]